MLDIVAGQGPGARDRVPQSADRRDRALCGARGAAVHRRLRHGLLPLHERGELERHRGLARPQARRLFRQSLLHADPSDLHPGLWHTPVEAHADEREPAERRPGVGAEAAGRQAASGADPGSGPRLLPGAPVSELRQPGAPRRRLAERQGGLRRGARRRRQRPRRLSRLRRRDRPARRGCHQDALRQPVRHVHAKSPTKIRTGCRCASTRPSTTRWAGCGSTTT